MREPLAIKMRPKKIEDIIGQSHLLKEGQVLYNLIHNDFLVSMILYGKPGIGKTSIATAMVESLHLKYRLLNAVINNKKDFDVVVEEAKLFGGLVVIMDEIHRLNKDKQDLLLPYLESGLITLIGLTTSNPYHKINPAIRSRCQIFELKELTEEEVILGLQKACSAEYLPNIKIDQDSLILIARLSNGDLRYAYNLLEIAYYASNQYTIDMKLLKKINSKPAFIHDKNEDGHYDVISALQKSIRGSDPDAALHYLARLVVAEDLDIILRRLIVIAYEDIGLANPAIGPKIIAACDAAERLGWPEARIPLGDIVIEMALSPKSNSGHIALDEAINDINKGNTGNVPDNIKTSSPTYIYPHNYKNDWVEQNYMPKELIGKKYYHKKNNRYEDNLEKLYKEMKGEK